MGNTSLVLTYSWRDASMVRLRGVLRHICMQVLQISIEVLDTRLTGCQYDGT